MANNNLKSAGEILLLKKDFMRDFMSNYMLRQLGLSFRDDLLEKGNFMKIIDFCLRTRQRIIERDVTKGEKYFDKNFELFLEYYNNNDMIRLKELVYNCHGVGQKIGSLILEVFIHYKGGKEEIEKELYVPIDTHVKRVLEESFQTHVPSDGVSTSASSYDKFQKLLSEHAPQKGNRIIFDYLWFVGKAFCHKVKVNHDANRSTNNYSRGFKLCHICWLQKVCQNENKWQ